MEITSQLSVNLCLSGLTTDMERQFNAKELSTLSIDELSAGEMILLSGTIYTARDAAHKRITAMLNNNEPLPFDIKGAAIYYAGPSGTPTGKVIGSCGPTTSGRMDNFAPRLYGLGLAATIGKGARSPEVIRAIVDNKGLYLAAIGGTGALLASCIKYSEAIAFPELGCEAVFRLEVEQMPLIVAIDKRGGNLFDH